MLPGLGNSKADYAELAAELEERGFAVEVAEVARADWLRNAAGLTDMNYWKGTLNPRPTVDWYLNKVALPACQVHSVGVDVATPLMCMRPSRVWCHNS